MTARKVWLSWKRWFVANWADGSDHHRAHRALSAVVIGNSSDLIPILKRCNRDLTIILITNEVNLPLMRKLRREGIFYHALKPVEAEDREEFVQAVRCAFNSAVH